MHDDVLRLQPWTLPEYRAVGSDAFAHDRCLRCGAAISAPSSPDVIRLPFPPVLARSQGVRPRAVSGGERFEHARRVGGPATAAQSRSEATAS
jgi:hypothetical protein